MRIALHNEAVGEAEAIEQRDEAFDRCVGRRITASRLIWKLVGGPENMRVRVPRAGRRHLARTVGMRHWAGDAWGFMGEIHLKFSRK
jgi:hypothetical protein